MKNQRGQILLPGLALFWTLTMLFLALIVYGKHVLMQMRVNMAAEATALSVARAQAEMMNKFASYNDAINPMLFPEYKGYAAIQRDARQTLDDLATYQLWYQFPQFQIFSNNVGRRVAKVNGCDRTAFIPTPSMLIMQDIEAILMKGYYPTSWPVNLESIYYARTWSSGQRKAQPPHRTHWLVSKNGVSSTASARLYLDVQADEHWQNGGFPSADPEHWWDDVQVQSLYPQFNARLLDKTPPGFVVLLEAM